MRSLSKPALDMTGSNYSSQMYETKTRPESLRQRVPARRAPKGRQPSRKESGNGELLLTLLHERADSEPERVEQIELILHHVRVRIARVRVVPQSCTNLRLSTTHFDFRQSLLYHS